MDVDVIVIGSGCGGGVMAHQLVRAGYSVLVLEKGGYYRRSDFAQWSECEAMAKCFEKGGLCSSADSNIIILAGSCVGGGSTINWSASFTTPQHVLREWNEQGLDAFR
jgi:long-chain-alcohol oxidase